MILQLATAVPPSAFTFDLNTLLSGGTGAALMGVIIWVGKLVLDRTIPSRSDSRAHISMVLESLTGMVTVLQEEKTSDASRLQTKQDRIESLEAEADKDYDRITELRAEIIDLRTRLAQKDRLIRILVTELRKLGAQVNGLDLDDAEVEISITTDEKKTHKQGTGTEEIETIGR